MISIIVILHIINHSRFHDSSGLLLRPTYYANFKYEFMNFLTGPFNNDLIDIVLHDYA